MLGGAREAVKYMCPVRGVVEQEGGVGHGGM